MTSLRTFAQNRAQARPAARTPTPLRIPVWDLPIRLFHWSLVALVCASWWTAQTGRLAWHRGCGYGVFALLLFRVYWGFAGSSTARFAQFVRGPRAIRAYARRLLVRGPAPTVGHNPIAAVGALGLLAALLAQVILGLFAVDVDGLESGPLSHWVSFERGRALAHAHHRVFDVALGLIALHLSALLFYWIYKRDPLLAAMVRGDRTFADPKVIAPRLVPLWRALPGALLAVALVWYLANQLGR